MPTAEKQVAFALRWLTKAKSDLAVARLVLQRDPEMEPWLAAYHAQQAAEKSLKALLIARSIEPDRKHDLVKLSEGLPAGLDSGASSQELATLSKYSSDVRYSGPYEQVREPTWEEAEAAVATARSVFDAATAQIRGT
ncbi:MAG: HEPN domain-containing protein [Candidatus Limnocylindrales bacterium]